MTSPIASSSKGQQHDQSLIHSLAPAKPADKAQRRFTQLVKKIEFQREHLKQWQDYGARYNQRLASELAPVEAQLRAKRRDMAILIDTLLVQPLKGAALSRAHRIQLRELLMSLLDGLLAEDEDEALEALRDKYRQPEDEERQRFEMDATQDMLSDMLDLEIGDDHGASTVEELMEYARRKMQERLQEDADREPDRNRQSRGDKRSRGNAKSQAAHAQREQAAKEVSQSLRDVFRKLVSALHPDREPDAQQRLRKNEMMQRVNLAYEANDLLTLLGLQLQIEQIDATHLSSIPPQRLAHYIQILGEQLVELEAEVERCRQPFRMMMNFGGRRQLTINDIERELGHHLAQLRNAIRELEHDLVAFRDPHRLRERLRWVRVQQDDFDLFGDLEDFAELADGPSRKRRRRNSGRW